jgi:hypothetical protein
VWYRLSGFDHCAKAFFMKLLSLVFVVLCVCGTAAADTPYKPTSKPPAGPVLSVPSRIDVPERERDYVALVEKARKTYTSAKSVDGRRAARQAFQIDSHNFLGLMHSAQGWVGIFKKSNVLADGRRSLEIEIAPGLTLETSDNTYDDRAYQNMIEPYAAMAKTIAGLSIGQPVSFSADILGAVLSSDDDMVLQPRLMVRFSDFTILDEPAPPKT